MDRSAESWKKLLLLAANCWLLTGTGEGGTIPCLAAVVGAVEIILKVAPGKLLEFALEGTGASSSLGTWRIDNLRLEGSLLPVPTPVPLPAAAGLLLTALPLLPRRARRVSPISHPC